MSCRTLRAFLSRRNWFLEMLVVNMLEKCTFLGNLYFSQEWLLRPNHYANDLRSKIWCRNPVSILKYFSLRPNTWGKPRNIVSGPDWQTQVSVSVTWMVRQWYMDGTWMVRGCGPNPENEGPMRIILTCTALLPTRCQGVAATPQV